MGVIDTELIPIQTAAPAADRLACLDRCRVAVTADPDRCRDVVSSCCDSGLTGPVSAVICLLLT